MKTPNEVRQEIERLLIDNKMNLYHLAGSERLIILPDHSTDAADGETMRIDTFDPETGGIYG